jgi:hypothetical protein
VRCPRVRDRVGEGGEHIRFSSTILPPYARRSKSLVEKSGELLRAAGSALTHADWTSEFRLDSTVGLSRKQSS